MDELNELSGVRERIQEIIDASVADGEVVWAYDGSEEVLAIRMPYMSMSEASDYTQEILNELAREGWRLDSCGQLDPHTGGYLRLVVLG